MKTKGIEEWVPNETGRVRIGLGVVVETNEADAEAAEKAAPHVASSFVKIKLGREQLLKSKNIDQNPETNGRVVVVQCVHVKEMCSAMYFLSLLSIRTHTDTHTPPKPNVFLWVSVTLTQLSPNGI